MAAELAESSLPRLVLGRTRTAADGSNSLDGLPPSVVRIRAAARASSALGLRSRLRPEPPAHLNLRVEASLDAGITAHR